MVPFKRGGYSDKKGVGWFRLGGGSEVSFTDRSANNDVKLRFNNVDITAINGIDRSLIYVDAYYFFFPRSEDGRRR